jgi:predicted Zn finger-like uncharacterized protein
MLIVCPNCASRYSIDEAKLGPSGRTVRCAQCRTSFFVAPPGSAGEEGADQLTQSGRADDMQAQARVEAAGNNPVNTPGDVAGDAASGSAASDAGGWDAARAAAPQPPDQGQLDSTDRAGNPDAIPGSETSPGMPAEREEAPPVAPSIPAKMQRGPRIVLPPFLSGLVARLAVPLRRVPPGIASVALAAAIVGGMVIEREPIVSGFPEMAALYRAVGLPVNLHGLELRNVTSEIVREGEARVLVIEGEIANPQDRVLSVPLLGLRVAGAQSEPLYEWTSEPQKPKLSPGDNLRFRARLVSPPAEGREVLVRFVSRASDAAKGHGNTTPGSAAGPSASPAASGDAARP